MIVLDASVIIDSLLPMIGDRYKKASELLETISKSRIAVHAPIILKIELASILSRKKEANIVRGFVEELISEIELISGGKLIDTAYNLAFVVKGRAVDLYYITTSKLTGSILITNDKIMAKNAKNGKVEAYYLIEEFEKVLKRIEGIAGD
ncbi:MAG TPA: type II toxin-antitoxin system VapC family toxin [Candidatus Bathyarchaeia archaeon]|nr:type II toxin-antitoxin system VapC family toxin [Candidatus Bathyarchaeia archaeon]